MLQSVIGVLLLDNIIKSVQSVASFLASIPHSIYTNFIEMNRWTEIVRGLENTLIITAFALILGVVIGLVLALFKIIPEHNPRLKYLARIADVYLTIIRGTPVVLQLMIWFYVVFASARNAIPIAIVGFGINSGAYVCEIFRGGILSIGKGQMEAGRSIGFTYGQTMRYIILPQALKNALPPLGNEFITLFKETSVVGYIAVHDLTRAAYNIKNATYDSFPPLIGAALIYLVFVILLTKAMSAVERRMRKGDIR